MAKQKKTTNVLSEQVETEIVNLVDKRIDESLILEKRIFECIGKSTQEDILEIIAELKIFISAEVKKHIAEIGDFMSKYKNKEEIK